MNGSKERTIPLGQAQRVGRYVCGLIAPKCEFVTVAGSVRRGRELVHDVDIVAIPRPGGEIRIGQAMRTFSVDDTRYRAGMKVVSVLGRWLVPGEEEKPPMDADGRGGPDGHYPPDEFGRPSAVSREPLADSIECQVDINFATAENVGMLLVVKTGSAQHNVWMARLAQGLGMKFAAGSGVQDCQGNVIAARTEEEVFGAFGLVVPDPARRELVSGEPLWTERGMRHMRQTGQMAEAEGGKPPMDADGRGESKGSKAEGLKAEGAER